MGSRGTGRIGWLLVVCLLWWPLHAGAAVELTGRLQQELGLRTTGQPVLTKALSFIQLEARHPVARVGRATIIGRVFYDAAQDLVSPSRLNPKRSPGDPLSEQFVGATLKEAYVDLSSERLDVRLGRQIVRWGLLEGTRITDRINPLDFREFLFRDIEDRYIPLWMVRADYYPGSARVQLLAIPDLRFHKQAPAGSEWAQFELPPGTRRPTRTFGHTEWAALVGGQVGQTALTASYFYTWDDFPAAFRTVFGVGGQPTGVTFDSRYERLHVVGVSASRDIGGAVASLEGSFDHGKRFATDPLAAISGNEIARDVVRAGVGVDVNLAGVDFSLLYVQERILSWHAFVLARRVEQAASLLVRDTLWNSRAEAQLLVLYFRTGHQYVARPGLSVRVTDRIKATLGADFLGGSRGSDPNALAGARDFRFVGFFKDRDRVTLTVVYGF